MADLSLLVDYSQVKKANKEISQIGSSAKKSAAVFEAAFKKAEVQQKKSIDAVQKQIALSKKMEAQKAKEAKVAASAAALVSKEEERLKNKFVEGYTAMNIYTKELNDLAVARKAGIITTEKQAAAVAQLNAQMKAGTGVFANAATGMRLVGKRANRTGVLAQQAGYQFGDFAVQVQSGTNPMVAFGQQATQLIGTFSMLAKSTKAIMAFSALGVLVPVLTAVAGAFMRAKEAADDSDLSVKAFGEAIKSAKEETLSLTEKLEFLKSGFKTKSEFTLRKDLELARAELKTLQDKQIIFNKAAISSVRAKTQANKLDKESIPLAEIRVELAEKELAKHLETLEAVNKREEIAARLLAQNEAFVDSLNEGADEARKKAEDQVNLVAQLEEKYGEAVVTALALSGVDLTSPISSAADEAARLAKNLGVALEVAAADLLEQRTLDQKYASLRKYGARGTTDSRRPTMDGKPIPTSSNKPTKTKGGGGSANVVNIEDIIAAREKQIKQERVLIGLSGKQRAAQEIYYDLLKQNEDADKKLTEAELHGAAKAIAAQEEQNRVLKEAKEQQNDLAQGIADSMGDAFMSVVDGTKSVKDAFKDMARAIIKQLFEVLVVQRLVGTVGSGNVAGSGLAGLLSGTLTNANGNVFSGGSQINAYANGGVVGGPTFFPMTGGKTGLMGEAGPEAIMPLKRGPNGKLGVQAEGGSQGNVVVNQSFNFQANGDDSVKRIIAEAAPRIADLTQRQIMDSRRRGGSMKATFG